MPGRTAHADDISRARIQRPARAEIVIAVQHEVHVNSPGLGIETAHRVGAHLWLPVIGGPDGQTVFARHGPFRLGDTFGRHEQHEMRTIGRIAPKIGTRKRDPAHMRSHIGHSLHRHLAEFGNWLCHTVAGLCETRPLSFHELDQVACRQTLHIGKPGFVVRLDAHDDIARPRRRPAGGKQAALNKSQRLLPRTISSGSMVMWVMSGRPSMRSRISRPVRSPISRAPALIVVSAGTLMPPIS